MLVVFGDGANYPISKTKGFFRWKWKDQFCLQLCANFPNKAVIRCDKSKATEWISCFH